MVNVARQVAIASDEIFPQTGISQSARSMRRGADKSSLGNAGNAIFCMKAIFRDGADPPKNVSGRTSSGDIFEARTRDVSAGNGACILVANLSYSGIDSK